MYNLGVGEPIFDIRERSFQFGIRIVKLVANLPRNSAGIAIGNQIIRSGTAIGANIEEAQNCGTKKEFIYCLTIALKEARETGYWLRLITETSLVRKEKLEGLMVENEEIIKILVTIVRKSKLQS